MVVVNPKNSVPSDANGFANDHIPAIRIELRPGEAETIAPVASGYDLELVRNGMREASELIQNASSLCKRFPSFSDITTVSLADPVDRVQSGRILVPSAEEGLVFLSHAKAASTGTVTRDVVSACIVQSFGENSLRLSGYLSFRSDGKMSKADLQISEGPSMARVCLERDGHGLLSIRKIILRNKDGSSSEAYKRASANAAMGKKKKHNGTTHQWTEAEREYIRLHPETSLAELAGRFDVSKKAIEHQRAKVLKKQQS
jgi:hypothetical protein